MKSVEFNRLTGQQLDALDDVSLKQLVKVQGNMANKRYQNIKSDPDAAKNAVSKVDRTGGRFSVKNKTHSQLVKEAKRIQNFNKSKTGTVKGAKAVTSATQKAATGQSAKEAQKKTEKGYKKAKVKEAEAKKGKKLSKKERKAIEKKAKEYGKKAAAKVKKQTEKKIKKYRKAKEKEAKKSHGPGYYPDADGKGAGAGADKSDSTSGSPVTKNEVNEEIMKAPESNAMPSSPYELADKMEDGFHQPGDGDLVPFK